MIDTVLKTPVTAQNVETIATGDDVLNIKELFQFIKVVKTALIDFNNTADLPKVTELCNSIPELVAGNYTPNGLVRLLGSFGQAGATLSYSNAASRLEEDLQVTKSVLSNINLIINNPVFAEVISV